MGVKNGAYFKTKRLAQISREIAKRLSKGKKINLDAFAIWIEVNLGLTNKKAREYIELSSKTHNWHIDKKGFLVLEEES